MSQCILGYYYKIFIRTTLYLLAQFILPMIYTTYVSTRFIYQYITNNKTLKKCKRKTIKVTLLVGCWIKSNIKVMICQCDWPYSIITNHMHKSTNKFRLWTKPFKKKHKKKHIHINIRGHIRTRPFY